MAADSAAVRAQAKNAALRLLARREHGQAELKAKLSGKGFAADVVAEVLSELKDQGLQSDQRFAAALARRRIGRGYGPAYVRSELQRRHVAPDLASTLVDQPDEYWLDVAARALAKKFPRSGGGIEPKPDAESAANAAKQQAAKARFLSQRGFPSDLIGRLLGSRC